MRVNGPTKEQLEILEHTGNTVVTARPGSGKTYTIVEKIAVIIPNLPKHQGIIAISYTNKASFELRDRCIKKVYQTKETFFGTIDKFYISQIIIPFSAHLTNNISDYKVVNDIPADSKYAELETAAWPLSASQAALLVDALSEGIIFLKLTGETALYILQHTSGAIRYLKSKYTHIIIDEYQDCGEIQHLIFTTLIDAGLTGIAVGDINQAIFGFTKRFPTYLISLVTRKDFKQFELSKNHRCHQSISEYSLCLFGASQTIPAEKRIFHVNISGNEQQLARAIDDKLEAIKAKYGVLHNNQIAILCRSNASSLKISKGLETSYKIFSDTLLDRDNSDWGRFFREILLSYFDDDIYAVDFAEQFFSEEYESIKYRKALNLCQKIFSATILQLKNCENDIRMLAELVHPNKCSHTALNLLHETLTTPELIDNFIPPSTEEINIMTLHKSKGLEFKIVFHMDMYKWIMPNENSDDSEKLQMLNLHYVGLTRAIEACYIMNGTLRYRTQQDDYIPAQPSPFLYKDGLCQRRRDVTWKENIP